MVLDSRKSRPQDLGTAKYWSILEPRLWYQKWSLLWILLVTGAGPEAYTELTRTPISQLFRPRDHFFFSPPQIPSFGISCSESFYSLYFFFHANQNDNENIKYFQNVIILPPSNFHVNKIRLCNTCASIHKDTAEFIATHEVELLHTMVGSFWFCFFTCSLNTPICPNVIIFFFSTGWKWVLFHWIYNTANFSGT